MSLVTLDAIRAAADRIRPIARRTPVLDVSDLAGRRLWLKCESQQPGGAFKIRGATNMLMRLPADACARGVITYSSGNHGQAVALAASKLGAPAVIVMPTTAPAVKVEGVKRWGGEVIFEGTTSVDRRTRAEAGSRGARPDDGAAVRSRVDHRGAGHAGTRNARTGAGRRRRSSCRSAAADCCRAWRRRSSCRGSRVTRRRRRAGGRGEDDGVARGGPSRHARRAPPRLPTA